MNVETDYTVRFPKSTGGHIEYTYHAPANTVSSATVDSPGNFPLTALLSNLAAISLWKEAIYHLFNPVGVAPPDTPADCRFDIDTNSIRVRPRSGDFKLDFTFDRTTKTISATARPPFDVSWAGFLYVVAQLYRFSNYCQDDWRNEANNGR